MSEEARKALWRSSAVIMIATLVSRVFGLVRMQVINYYFEQSMLDPFWSAFKIPNTLRELLGEGALSVAFIPVFTAILASRGNAEANKLASNVFNILFVVVSVIVGASILLADVYMPAYVTGFAEDGVRLALAIDLAMVMMPFLLFASMGAVVMGILNGHKHFAAPAFAPVFFTLTVVSSVILFHETLGVMSLGWGVLAGGLLQLLIQLPFLKGNQFRYHFTFDIHDPGVREILRLMGPAALALGVVQLNQLMAPFFASYAEGGMAALQNSILLIQMPQGVFAVAVSTALLPTLAEQAGKHDFDAFRHSMRDGLGLVLLFTVPAALFFLFMGQDVVSAVFNLGGKFSLAGEMRTARSLFYYSFGLIGMGGTVLANRFFYSLKDMKTPFRVAILSVGVNLAANIVFHYLEMGFEFIALANSLAVSINFLVLIILIQKRSGPLPWDEILPEAARIVIASSLMLLVVFLAHTYLQKLFPPGPAAELFLLGIVIAFGAALFFGLCHLLRVREVSLLVNMLKRRLHKGEHNE